ncbi:acetamidase/formamidase family protein [Oxyplasma meridianum]|uniref:Acetamidase/formamidase family protein n=1 Tax=Oxyplasma meridianum TaxID=3073602 RepID=A0AAX4NGD5_9ARCH
MRVLDGRDEKNLHFKWSPEVKSVIRIEPGEILEVLVPDSSTMQIKKESKLADLGRIDNSKFDAAVGAIEILGAKKGDTLEVTIVDIIPDAWGWTAIMKDFGLLKNRFQESLVIWNISGSIASSSSDFLKGVRIPVRPFLGVIGTAPEKGTYGMIPPQRFGGNMDNKMNGVGSRIMLPVNIDGGMLSISDPHASQGDGEICGTAIETSARVRLMVKIIRKKHELDPIVYSKSGESESMMCAMGIDSDLHSAAVKAAENMIHHLSLAGYKPEEAYILCSVAGDLRISEIVDEPNFVVSMCLPTIFLRQNLH